MSGGYDVALVISHISSHHDKVTIIDPKRSNDDQKTNITLNYNPPTHGPI